MLVDQVVRLRLVAFCTDPVEPKNVQEFTSVFNSLTFSNLFTKESKYLPSQVAT